MNIREFQSDDTAEVIQLWKDCELTVPWNDPYKDIQRKLAVQPEMFLVGLLDNRIIASVMTGYDGHRSWINYLAVYPDHRRNGFGRQIMEETEKLLYSSGCPKINLQVRSTNESLIAFYRTFGFKTDDLVSPAKHLESDIK